MARNKGSVALSTAQATSWPPVEVHIAADGSGTVTVGGLAEVMPPASGIDRANEIVAQRATQFGYPLTATITTPEVSFVQTVAADGALSDVTPVKRSTGGRLRRPGRRAKPPVQEGVGGLTVEESPQTLQFPRPPVSSVLDGLPTVGKAVEATTVLGHRVDPLPTMTSVRAVPTPDHSRWAAPEPTTKLTLPASAEEADVVDVAPMETVEAMEKAPGVRESEKVQTEIARRLAALARRSPAQTSADDVEVDAAGISSVESDRTEGVPDTAPVDASVSDGSVALVDDVPVEVQAPDELVDELEDLDGATDSDPVVPIIAVAFVSSADDSEPKADSIMGPGTELVLWQGSRDSGRVASPVGAVSLMESEIDKGADSVGAAPRSSWTRRRLALTATGVVCSVALIAGGVVVRDRQADSAREAAKVVAAQDALAQWNAASTDLGATCAAGEVMWEQSAGRVGDDQVRTDLRSLLDQCTLTQPDSASFGPHVDSVAITELSALILQVSTAITAVSTEVASWEKGQAQADSDAAGLELQSAIDAAELVLTGSEGKVLDNGVRQGLADAIAGADIAGPEGSAVLALTAWAATAREHVGVLNAAVTSVVDAQAAWQAEQDRIAAEQAAAIDAQDKPSPSTPKPKTPNDPAPTQKPKAPPQAPPKIVDPPAASSTKVSARGSASTGSASFTVTVTSDGGASPTPSLTVGGVNVSLSPAGGGIYTGSVSLPAGVHSWRAVAGGASASGSIEVF